MIKEPEERLNILRDMRLAKETPSFKDENCNILVGDSTCWEQQQVILRR